MAISSAEVTYGLSAIGNPVGTNLSGSMTIGVRNTRLAFPDALACYSLRAFFANTGDELIINPLTGDTSSSDVWIAGAAQVETATAAGTITLAGNAQVIVTAAGMTGSPKTFAVAVALSDTPTLWAEKVRTALAADAAVSELFTVSGATDKIILTRKPTFSNAYVSFYADNDATLNISLGNGTCTGITTATTSANTTAGVLTDGVKIFDGDGKDWEGVDLPAGGVVSAILVETSDALGWTNSAETRSLTENTKELIFNDSNSTVIDGVQTFVGNAGAELVITALTQL